MVTVEKVRGGRYHHTELGLVEIGDRADVSESLAAYLCDGRGDFERVEHVTTVDYEEVDEDDAADDLESLTYDELYDRATERDIAGRSEMDKDELIAALQED